MVRWARLWRCLPLPAEEFRTQYRTFLLQPFGRHIGRKTEQTPFLRPSVKCQNNLMSPEKQIPPQE